MIFKRCCSLHRFGFCVALSCALLAFISHSPEKLTLLIFAGLMAAMFVFYALAYRSMGQATTISATTVFAWAVLFRCLGFLGDPIFEDDYFRYLWDGYRFASAGMPYGKPPEAFFNDPTIPIEFQNILSRINHPDIPTIYAPTLQYFFLIAHWLAPGHLWSIKLLLIAVDLGLIAALFRLAGAQRTLLYAWNPLVIKEIAFTAHPDSLIPALLIGCWMAGSKNKQGTAGLLLALAVATKASAGLIAPFMLLNIGRLGTLVFLAGTILLYLPFWIQGASDITGLGVFAQQFEFNSAFYGLLTLWMSPFWAKTLLGFVLLALSGAYFIHYWRSNCRSLPHGECLFGLLLLVSPVINPWYLLWLLPFACCYFELSLWIASAAVLLSYATGLNLEHSELSPYEHPVWVRPVEFGTIGLVFLADKWRRLSHLLRDCANRCLHELSRRKIADDF